jgi:hypothetical protein
MVNNIKLLNPENVVLGLADYLRYSFFPPPALPGSGIRV